MSTAVKSRLENARSQVSAASRLLAEGRPGEARSWLEQAIVLAPSWAEPHVLMAQAHLAMGDGAGAEAAVRTALEADPGHAGAAHMLGGLLAQQDRLGAALTWYRAAVELDPTVAVFHRDLGVVQLFLGQIDAGRRSLQEALRLDPLSDEVIDTLAHVLPAGGRGEEAAFLFGMLRDLGARGDLPLKARAQVHFALGKILEQRGEADAAFAEIAAGNALMRRLVTWDAEATERRLARVAQVFDADLLSRLQDHGAADARPIFIVGMPRSGSTLVEQIVSAHPLVYGSGEVDILKRMIADSQGPGGAPFPEWGRTMVDADCRNLAGIYLQQLPKGLPGHVRTTDKRLENFEYLGLIHLMMPNATIIHCRRDPRDSCFSAFSLRFSGGQEYSYDQAELGRYWRAYDRLMAHWRRVLPPGRMLEVSYEGLVADLASWAPKIIAHCGLDWDEACLRFHEAKRAVRSASLAQVREPIFTRSIGRWEPFAAHLQPLFDAMEGRSGPA